MIDSGTLLQGRFLIEGQIGIGGMGAVYRAVDEKFGSPVAIKETFYGDTELGEAFEREARLLNGLHHPIFPHVSDYFTENGGHFLVMEYIEGEDLSEILRRGETCAVSTVMGWTLDILDGLDYLHSQDPPIIHRDIKPNNLKLTPRGRIVLLDFGMAKETSHNTLGAKSVFGYSRRYSPLEQIEGIGTDVRSDIFSLGATVYHLLTGKAPVDVLARASAIVSGRPDPLLPVSSINTDVPESVAAILNSALALSPENRFESVRAMSNAFEYAIDTNPISQKKENENLVAPSDNGVDTQSVESAAYAAMAGIVANGASERNASTIPVSDVPADESWRNSSSPMGNDEVRVATLPIVSEKSSPAGPAILAVRPADIWKRMQSIPSVRIRRPARPGYVLWVPALLICLAVILFGTYRAVKTEEQTLNVSTEPPASEAPTNMSNEGATPDSLTDQPAGTDDLAESETVGAVTSTDEAEPTHPAAAGPKREKRGTAPEPERAKPAVSRNQNRRSGSGQSRRTVQPAFEQPRVSSIEAIFTGVPYERRRRWEDTYLSPEEEMRRRRIRRVMRENQRRQLPF